MVSNGKPTRNADYRHAQSIARQRQAAQRATADISTGDLTHILPQDESPMLPDAAPAAVSQPSWRDHEPAIVHSIKWVDTDKHEYLHIVRGDDIDEVLGHLKKVKVVIAAARARDGAGDWTPVAEELSQCREVPSVLHRGADEPNSPGASRESAPYCHEHDTQFFRNVWKNGRVSWSHRKADGSGFCQYKG